MESCRDNDMFISYMLYYVQFANKTETYNLMPSCLNAFKGKMHLMCKSVDSSILVFNFLIIFSGKFGRSSFSLVSPGRRSSLLEML